MPARKRNRGPAPSAAAPAAPAAPTKADKRTAQADAARVFAERQAADKRRQKEEAQVRRAAQEREDRRRRLTQDKDRAAARLKDVRRRDAPGSARAEAEAAYRAALDALIRDEQGLPPVEDAAPSDGEAEPTAPVVGGDADAADDDVAEADAVETGGEGDTAG